MLTTINGIEMRLEGGLVKYARSVKTGKFVSHKLAQREYDTSAMPSRMECGAILTLAVLTNILAVIAVVIFH